MNAPLLRVFAVLSVLTYMVVAAGLVVTQAPWSDEGYLSNPALNLLNHGFMATTLRKLTDTETYLYYNVPFHYVFQAGWFWIFDWSLVSVRSIAWAFGLLYLGSVYVLAQAITKRRDVALISVIVLATEYFFANIGASGRPEMMVSALGIAGLAVYGSLSRKKPLLGYLGSHTLVCLSGLTHPLGVIYFVALVVWQLSRDRQHLSRQLILAAFAPYILAGMAWGIYISQDFQLFLDEFFGGFLGYRVERGMSDPLYSLWTGISKLLAPAYGLSPEPGSPLARVKALVLLCFVSGLLYVAWLALGARKDSGARCLVGFGIIAIVMPLLLTDNRNWYYLVHWVPLFAVSFSWMVADMLLGSTMVRRTAIGLLVLIVVISVGGNIYRITKDQYHDHTENVTAALKQFIGKNEPILGPAELIFGLSYSYNLIDDQRPDAIQKHDPVAIVYRSYDAQNLGDTITANCGNAGRLCRFELVYRDRGFRAYMRAPGDVIQ